MASNPPSPSTPPAHETQEELSTPVRDSSGVVRLPFTTESITSSCAAVRNRSGTDIPLSASMTSEEEANMYDTQAGTGDDEKSPRLFLRDAARALDFSDSDNGDTNQASPPTPRTPRTPRTPLRSPTVQGDSEYPAWAQRMFPLKRTHSPDYVPDFKSRTLFEMPPSMLSGATVTRVSAPDWHRNAPLVMTYMVEITRPRSTPLSYDGAEAEDLVHFLKAYDHATKPRETKTQCPLSSRERRLVAFGSLLAFGGVMIAWGAKMLYEGYTGKFTGPLEKAP